MTDEYSRAISFTNGYFSLVDGLASGLENHLAEDVVLDWFGRTVRGRKNVAAFIQAHKVNSRHVFSNITPVVGIGYGKNCMNRKKNYLAKIERKLSDDEGMGDAGHLRDTKLAFNAESCLEQKREVKMENPTEMSDGGDTKREIVIEDDMTYDFNDDDLSNLFSLEITSTNTAEIEASINRMKLEEETTPTLKVVKQEYGQGDGPAMFMPYKFKYVEANGEVEFTRRAAKRDRDPWNEYVSPFNNIHKWQRTCRLQIAYSVVSEQELQSSSKYENARSHCEETNISKHPRKRLPSLDEITQLSSKLVPNANHFGGYLKRNDFYEDRADFLESLETEMALKVPNCPAPVLLPRYVDNKLVFNKTFDGGDCGDAGRRKDFIFNYRIHLIIYEDRNDDTEGTRLRTSRIQLASSTMEFLQNFVVRGNLRYLPAKTMSQTIYYTLHRIT